MRLTSIDTSVENSGIVGNIHTKVAAALASGFTDKYVGDVMFVHNTTAEVPMFWGAINYTQYNFSPISQFYGALSREL